MLVFPDLLSDFQVFFISFTNPKTDCCFCHFNFLCFYKFLCLLMFILFTAVYVFIIITQMEFVNIPLLKSFLRWGVRNEVLKPLVFSKI
jgi:hypothetical protein